MSGVDPEYVEQASRVLAAHEAGANVFSPEESLALVFQGYVTGSWGLALLSAAQIAQDMGQLEVANAIINAAVASRASRPRPFMSAGHRH